jgi:hypothetical protein
MLRDCPVPESLVDFIEALDDEDPGAPDRAEDAS